MQPYRYRYWFVLIDLCILYAPYFYSSEAVYKKPEAVDKPVPEPPVLVEPDIIDELDSEVVDEAELEPELEENIIETLVDLPAEPIMELVPSLTLYL